MTRSKARMVRRKSATMTGRIAMGMIVALGLPPVPSASAQEGASPLAPVQTAVTQRYEDLERLLLRLADVEASENPRRAALLRRAAKLSRDKLIGDRLRTAAGALEGEEFQRAIDAQSAARREMLAVLKLLQSEDRGERIRKERERYRELLSRLRRGLNTQREVRVRNENGARLDDLRQDQADVRRRAEGLERDLAEDNRPDEPDQAAAENPDNDRDSSERSDGNRPSDSEDRGKKDDARPESSDEDSSSPATPPEAEPSEGKPSDSGGSAPDQNAGPPKTPQEAAERRVRAAADKMRRAEKSLERAEDDPAAREQAVKEQRQAEAELREAIEKLEEILRQLREEEKGRELARLESRLRKIVQLQQEVLDDTRDLARVPVDDRGRGEDLQAAALSLREKTVVTEIDRALLVLREEGSSVAFPEVMTQVRSDAESVVDLLGRTRIDDVCQGLQEDVLASLGEMLSAVERERRDMEQKKQSQGPSPPPPSNQQRPEPLVAKIAELRLIRTMETRIQAATRRYQAEMRRADADAGEMLPLLRKLADRQRRLYQITRDLVEERNR